MTRNLSIFNQLRPVTIGFDDVFNHFESMFDILSSNENIQMVTLQSSLHTM